MYALCPNHARGAGFAVRSIRRAQTVKDTYEDRILAKTFVPCRFDRKVRVLSQVERPRQQYSTYSTIYHLFSANTDPKTRALSKQLRYIPDYVRIPFVYG